MEVWCAPLASAGFRSTPPTDSRGLTGFCTSTPKRGSGSAPLLSAFGHGGRLYHGLADSAAASPSVASGMPGSWDGSRTLRVRLDIFLPTPPDAPSRLLDRYSDFAVSGRLIRTRRPRIRFVFFGLGFPPHLSSYPAAQRSSWPRVMAPPVGATSVVNLCKTIRSSFASSGQSTLAVWLLLYREVRIAF